MQVRVKSEVSYSAFCRGRDIDSAVHREDDTPGFIIGLVDEATLQSTDIRITEAEYHILMDELKAYNAAYMAERTRLARLAPQPDPVADLVTELNKIFTARGQALTSSESEAIRGQISKLRR